MPVGFNSPARNLFLLGSSGAQVVTNFFKTIDKSAGTDGAYLPDEIKYNFVDQKFVLAGSASDSNSKGFGWFEKRNEAGTADFENRIESTQSGVNTTLRAMELDSNDNLIVVGKTGTVPWIAKYSNGGVIDWQSTTNSGDVEYTGVISDSNGQYYACGNTPTSGEAQAFVEKFDASGNPGWGKSAFMLGRDVVLNRIAANSRGEVVAVGYLEDNVYNKGYIVKIDTNTGEVLWDRTLSPDWQGDMLNCSDVYIDSNDQIYVTVNGTFVGYLIKYTAEGNMIWQKTTDDPSSTITFDQVKSDGETEQTIVFGTYDDGSGDVKGVLSKYSKDGSLVWRRTLLSTYNSSDYFSNVCLDADASFYYLLFVDDVIDGFSGTPERYTFGKVSSSGNGLGDFSYFPDSFDVIDYTILSVGDKIGRISDGSVRQDTSDLITYPFNANKLLFDDLATQVSNKKRQMDTADSFEYSGSPAIRPADFQDLNLLGDVYSGSGNWLDQSGKGNDGVVNGATWNASGYWQFDGVNDYINLPKTNSLANWYAGPHSIEMWFIADNFNLNSNLKGPLIGLSDLDTSGEWWSLGWNNSSVFNFYYWNGSQQNLTGSTTLSTATWYHAVFTHDSGTIKLYLNGSQDASGSVIGTPLFDLGSQFDLTVGASANGYHDGSIGEVRIYPRALTPAQVFQNYNATKTKYINEAPDIAPKIGPGIVYDSNLLLNYDFGNKATYNTYRALADIKFDTTRITNTKQTLTSVVFDADSNYGSDVAIGGGKIAVGAHLGGEGFNGAVYIYDLDGTNEIKLSPTSDRFGQSVAIGHDKLVVGAPYDGGTGAVYIYDLDGSNETKITASDGASSDYFGWSVAVGNDKIFVGAYGDDDNGSLSGSVYVYDLDGSNETKITASDGVVGDRFGWSVAVGNDKIVVGAPRSGNIDYGAVYVYDLDGTNEVKLNPETGTDDRFGDAVAIGDGKLVVGVSRDNNQELLILETGSVYIYNIHDLTENPIKIYASDLAANRNFGTSVAVGDNKIVVGANTGLLGSSFNDESVYVYDLDGTNELKLGNYIGGNAVAIKDGIILTGHILDDEASLFSYLTPLPTTVKNLSSTSYTGTINGATFNPAGYFVLDGVDDYFDNGNIALTASGGWTVELWFKPNQSTHSSGTWNYLFRDAGAGNPVWECGFYSTGLTFSMKDNAVPSNGNVVEFVTTNGQWHYLAVGIDSSTHTFLTGSSVAGTLSTDTKAVAASSGICEINTLFCNELIGNFLGGEVGEIRIYDRALTLAERTQNFNATRRKYGV